MEQEIFGAPNQMFVSSYLSLLNNETFLGTLGQLYREIQIQQQAEMMGYTVDSITTNAQGDTVIEVYAWA